MNEKIIKGYKTGEGDVNGVLLEFALKSVASDVVDSVLTAMKIPTGESYVLMAISDPELIKKAEPVPPVMPVNAANAVKKFTRKGKGSAKTAVFIRPCEVRAVVELVKLSQIKQDDIFLITYDCAGSIPILDFIHQPEKKTEEFQKVLNEREFNSDIMKSVCSYCTGNSRTASDIHFSMTDDGIFVSANNEKGSELLKNMKIEPDTDISVMDEKISESQKIREKTKNERFSEIKKDVEGLGNFNKIFESCIGCHNCGSVCPICYCRQCFFDSTVNEQNSDLKLIRADQKGVLSFPPDKLMYHIGRMTHMSLSCVSCGLCSDACPVDIPVADIFSYVGSQTQSAFEYEPGGDVEDALPMRDYKTEELGELGELVKSVELQEEKNA